MTFSSLKFILLMMNSLKFKVEVMLTLKLFTSNITLNGTYLILLCLASYWGIYCHRIFKFSLKRGFWRFLPSHKQIPIWFVLGMLDITRVSAPSAGSIRIVSSYPRQNWILQWWKGKDKVGTTGKSVLFSNFCKMLKESF